jgi:hypothetical protein
MALHRTGRAGMIPERCPCPVLAHPHKRVIGLDES